MEAGKHLWERDHQLATAAHALVAARAGRGRALFLIGAAGLGKTTLLDEVCAKAERDDVAVVRTFCDPMEASLAFGLLGQIVHGLGGDHGPGAETAEPTAAPSV